MPAQRTAPQNLSARIQKARSKYPDLAELFRDITTYIEESTLLLQSPVKTQKDEGPKAKKRKLSDSSPTETFDSITDVSFSIPQRKKLKLELSQHAQKGSLRATNTATSSTEFGLQWQNIEYCVCVPVPEKAQPQYNYCIFPRDEENGEQILFTIPGGKMKPGAITSGEVVDPEESYKDAVTRMLNKRLKNPVAEPNEKDFVSQVAQAHRKGEKAVHVKAFRGSKDGFLFLLPLGLLYGFKKPLLFFPFHTINSISYTSILQRTFNLNVAIFPNSSSQSSSTEQEPKEYEFSMIDQADFAGIDAYVRRHGLQDASMAEQRRAKRLNINGVGKGKGDRDGGEDGEDGDGEGELAKAAREVEEMDDEDEEEDENFDPGSEGESEGSGESSNEEEEEDERGDEGGEELGSEAEDASE